jgi:hypothetical protein
MTAAGSPTTRAALPASAPAPFVSVVLPARDAGRHLDATLTALLAGDYPAERLEVLVVVAPSADDTAAVADRWAARDGRLRRLDNPAGATPAGLNIGIRAARGEVIVRLDAHARPAPDYVTACVAALARTGAAVVGGRMTGVGATPFGAAVALATATPFGAGGAAFRQGGAGPVDTVYLGAWPRAVFDRVGLFDEDLARNQDYELCERIRRVGGTVWLDPAIRTVTETRGTPAALARQYFAYGQGRAGTLARHPGSLRARQALPAGFVAGLAALALGAVAGPTARPARSALVTALAAYGAADALAAWRADPSGRHRFRLLGIYPILHLAWGAGFWVGQARQWARLRR